MANHIPTFLSGELKARCAQEKRKRGKWRERRDGIKRSVEEEDAHLKSEKQTGDALSPFFTLWNMELIFWDNGGWNKWGSYIEKKSLHASHWSEWREIVECPIFFSDMFVIFDIVILKSKYLKIYLGCNSFK